MSTDATTLYKLMVLYMLDKVNFPLSNSQIADFMLDRQYTNYFTLQEVLSSLASDGFVQILTYRSSTQYKLTKEGIDTISFFYNKISQAIRDDIDKYLKDNKYDLKCEVNVAVPLESQADAMCARWRDASQDIYDFVMNKLM